jgi:hypothetical protein
MMPLISRMRLRDATEVIGQILSRFSGQRDRTRFGLMNAVTSVARDTRDPDLRWRLEELGGAIGAAKTPTPSSFDPAAAAITGNWGNLSGPGGPGVCSGDEIYESSEDLVAQ